METDVQKLFSEIKKYDDYPETMIRICGEIERTAFFPGGRGTIDNSEELSTKHIMILGQDFDCEKNFNTSKTEGSEDIKRNPTWRNTLKLLKECQIPENDCFFTNAILGIRKGKVGTGKSPAFKDDNFMEYCRAFFLKQLEIQRPRLILVLGKYTAQFLSPLSDDLQPFINAHSFSFIDDNDLQVIPKVRFTSSLTTTIVILIHPSLRHLNINRRRYLTLAGHEAEIAMIKDGLKYSITNQPIDLSKLAIHGFEVSENGNLLTRIHIKHADEMDHPLLKTISIDVPGKIVHSPIFFQSNFKFRSPIYIEKYDPDQTFTIDLEKEISKLPQDQLIEIVKFIEEPLKNHNQI